MFILEDAKSIRPVYKKRPIIKNISLRVATMSLCPIGRTSRRPLQINMAWVSRKFANMYLTNGLPIYEWCEEMHTQNMRR